MNMNDKKQKLIEIYTSFEEDVKEYKSHALCKLGCTFCCTDVANVDIVTLEALIFRERLQEMVEPIKSRIKSRLVRNKKEKERGRISVVSLYN
jgi:hypothetical protein